MPTSKPNGASVRLRPRTDGTVAGDVRYRINGASRTTSFVDPESAHKFASIVRAVGPVEALAYLQLTTKAGTPTVSEYAETYISSKSGVETRTTDDYRTYMRLHITPTFGHLPLDAVSPATVAAWINAKADNGYASKSIKNWHGFLSAMFESALDDALITRNPCSRSRLPEMESTEMVFLSPDEFTTLFSYIPPHWQPIVLTLAATGMRWGEATALRPTDFDLEARSVRISRAWKSSKSRGWYIGPPKTKRSKRTISLPENLIPVVRPLIEAGHEYVFVNTRGKPIRQNNFWAAVWDPARRLANGVPAFASRKGEKDAPWSARSNGVWDARKPAAVPLGKHPRVHDLRHSHVAWLLAEGVGIDVISRRLGHESIQTTIDIYGHITVERFMAAGVSVGHALAGAMAELTS